MFCSKCGTENADTADFCNKCGCSLKGYSKESNVSTTNAFQKYNVWGIVAGIVAAMGVFLPFISISFFGSRASRSLIEGGDGWIYLAIIILGIVFAVLKNKWGLIICGMVTFIFFFSGYLGYMDSIKGEYLSDLVEKGVGFYCIFFGSIGMILAGLIYKKVR